MGSSNIFYLCALILGVFLASTTSSALSSGYYDKSCPNALPTIKQIVQAAVRTERRMGASLLRLHFHDCFVNGCDGSVLLDSTSSIDSEKNARPNKGSLRGFEVIDQIKSAVDKACGRPVVSCADVLAVAARDSVVALGGPSWEVQLGRTDSTTASKLAAEANLPSPIMELPELINNFKKQGLDVRDLVALSGGHTLGFGRCATFKNRIYNETNIDSEFARDLRTSCPPSGGDSNLSPLDLSPARFDVSYFTNLSKKRGLLKSDQALFDGGVGLSDSLVRLYGSNAVVFSADFARSMIKMGNIKPLTGNQGQIRRDCKRVN